MAGVILPGSARPGGGDIEGVTAGDGLSGGGSSGSVTVTLDLNELTAAAVADGDFIAIIDANDSNASRKEAVAAKNVNFLDDVEFERLSKNFSPETYDNFVTGSDAEFADFLKEKMF